MHIFCSQVLVSFHSAYQNQLSYLGYTSQRTLSLINSVASSRLTVLTRQHMCPILRMK